MEKHSNEKRRDDFLRDDGFTDLPDLNIQEASFHPEMRRRRIRAIRCRWTDVYVTTKGSALPGDGACGENKKAEVRRTPL